MPLFAARACDKSRHPYARTRKNNHNMIAPIKVILSLGSLGMIAQIVPTTGPPTAVETIAKLTLDGGLVIAVGVLWKALKDVAAYKDSQIALKDAQITVMATKVTETLVLVLEAVKEARRSSDDIGTALDNLTSNLAALPCWTDSSLVVKAEKKDHQRRHGVRPPA